MKPTQRIRKTVFWIGLALPVFALVATIWATHETNGQVNAAFASVTHTYKILNTLAETQAHIAVAETGQRGYLLTGRKDYFDPYDAAMATVNNDIQQLKTLTRDTSIQQANLVELQRLVTKRLSIDPEKIAFSQTKSTGSL